MVNYTGTLSLDAALDTDFDIDTDFALIEHIGQHVKSLGRRVFRGIPGKVKQFRNRFNYTGGGIKEGAKLRHSDARRERRLALDAARLDDLRLELADLPRVNVVEFCPSQPAISAVVSTQDEHPDREVQFSNEDCLFTLIYRGGKIVFARTEPIHRVSSRRRRRR